MNFLTADLLHFHFFAESPQAAIKESGRLLVNAGMAEPSYVSAMLASFRDNGPYFVIAPGIAIAHARPEDGSLGSAVSLVTLKKPVVFGCVANDPVSVVFGLSSYSGEEHIQALKKIVYFVKSTSVEDNIKI